MKTGNNRRRLLRAQSFKRHRYEGLPFLDLANDRHRDDPYLLHDAVRNPTGLARIELERAKRMMPCPRRWLREREYLFLWGGVVRLHGAEYEPVDMGTDWRCMKPWQCFNNAAAVARKSNGRMRYVEGLLMTPFGAYLHAWNAKDGKAYDHTFPASHLCRYFGIDFSLEFLDGIGRTWGGVFFTWDPTGEYLKARAARP